MTNEPTELASHEVTVFHGTTWSAAQRITRGGFEPRSVSALVAEVSAETGVDPDAIAEDLTAYSRFAVIDPARSDTVSLATDRPLAPSWAQRAPEARWEALWAVYRIAHPELGYDWNTSDEGHWWVMSRMVGDPPVLIECRAALGALLRCPPGEGPMFDGFGLGLEQALFVLEIAVEVRARPLSLTPVATTWQPRWVDRSLLRFMTGESAETVEEQVAEGLWGPLAGVHHEEPSFVLEEVWRRLPTQRRQHLKDLARSAVRTPH